MHIIIDGYNILKQILPSEYISDKQRRAFIALLGRYSVKKQHQITVVFDGGSDLWPFQEKDHGVIVVYAGIKQSADDIIKRYIKERKHSFLIVSSDAELQQAAKNASLTSMAAIEFYSLVQKALQPAVSKKMDKKIIKSINEENALVDDLMYGDMQPLYKPELLPENSRTSRGYTISKKEKVYRQKIKKLE